MGGTFADHAHDICPTSLDPPESTPHATSESVARWPLCRPRPPDPGGSRLIPDENVVPNPPPARDPLDPSLPLVPTICRSVRNTNRLQGIFFRHDTWRYDRERVQQALGEPYLESRRARYFYECGSQSIVLQDHDDPSRYKVACKRCHDRFCLPCSQDRARLIIANMKDQLEHAPTRFLTLTLRHNPDPLNEQIDRLYLAFFRLRRLKFWRELVTGGIGFLELKLGRGDGQWHPHLHVLIRGKYVPQNVLSDAWLQCTGDSKIVDIRMAGDEDGVYSYLARYVTKGWGPGIYRNPAKLLEAIEALKGRKLLLCFGVFSQLKLLQPPDKGTWDELGTLFEVRELAKLKITWAVKAFNAIYATEYIPPTIEVPPDT